ncbi:MAG: hypothetical protein BA863_07555 [Desulfovibrio sp. S3730MH75]|nr:MAG: hypothetical protein BA863_07555 [Desulfovibrio sp. S3730MH75]
MNYLLCSIFFAAFTILAPLYVSAAKVSKVFIVASYELGHVCGGPQEDGVMKGLAGQGFIEGADLQIERYYMDSKGKNTTAESMKEQGANALEKIKEFAPNVVVTIDDNAFREVGLKLVGNKDISVVFSGLNGQPEDYGKIIPFIKSRELPGENVTGVYEKLYVEQSVRVMKAIPSLSGDTVVFITDVSPTGKALSKQFAIELKSPLKGLKYRFEQVAGWEEYVELIRKINDDESVMSIYPVALSLESENGQTYTAGAIFKWTIANGNKPEMALNYFFSKIGLLGGAAVDFKGMGVLAGEKAGEILNGVKAGLIPIEDAPEYAIVFNIKRAKQLGITIPIPLLTAADYVYK